MTSISHQFTVPGSPVSVNRYGTQPYKSWRDDVYLHSVARASWTGIFCTGTCSVYIRYYRRLDRQKDVDNILKAILDGLDGKVSGSPKKSHRVLHDDRDVEHVVSRRTSIDFSTKLDGRQISASEYGAALEAIAGGAAVAVMVGGSPNHKRSVVG